MRGIFLVHWVFIPVTPGSDLYALGSPLVKEATLKLSGGKTLKISLKNQSEKKYLREKSISQRKIILKEWSISHKAMMKGGEMIFEMSDSF